MNRVRTFIAIDIPDTIKRRLRAAADAVAESSECNLVPEENWHITLKFLGAQDEILLGQVTHAMTAAAAQCEAPEILIDRIMYGPESGEKKMLWAVGDIATSKKLSSIRDILEDELARQHVNFSREFKLFKTHITLARDINTATLPPLDAYNNMKLRFQPETLELVESQLTKPHASYFILQSAKFKSRME